ncbi:MAG TPA: hypothetical protein VGP72_27705 [Planctomycetota bacterium]|jgi:WD40 repeat protein
MDSNEPTTMAAPIQPAPVKRRWLPRLRFSLRTLIIGVLMVGSAGGLWWRWPTWRLDRVVFPPEMVYKPQHPDKFTMVGCDRTKRGVFCVWNFKTGKHVAVKLFAQRQSLPKLSPDLSRVAVGNMDASVHVIDVQSGNLLHTLAGHSAPVLETNFSPDAQLLVSRTEKEVFLWNLTSGAKIRSLDITSGTPLSATFSPSGRNIIVSFSFPNDWKRYPPKYCVFDVKTGASLTIPRHCERTPDRYSFFSDGTCPRIAAGEDYCQLFDAETAAPLRLIDGTHAYASPDGLRVVAIRVGRCDVLDTASGRFIADIGMPVEEGACDWMNFSPTGRRIVGILPDRTARIWDARTGAELGVLSGVPMGMPGCDAWFLDDDQHVATSVGTATYLWSERRPAHKLGVAWLPEFWLTLMFSVGLFWSVWRDRRSLGG